MNISTSALIRHILNGSSNLMPVLASRIDNYNEINTDIVLLIGQSNMTGHSTSNQFDANIDFPHPDILQRPPVGTYANTEILASEPLWHHDKQPQGAVGLGLTFAKRYKKYSDKTLLLLPQAQGGTGFSNNFWKIGDSLYTSAVANTNNALAANPKSRLAAILWHQGESDVNYNPNQFLEKLILMIKALRSSINGATNVPFILGEMAPTWVSGNANRVAIQQALAKVPKMLPNCHLVSSANLAVDGSGIHFTGASYRTLGARYANTLISAMENRGSTVLTAPVPSVSEIGATGLTLAWDYVNGAKGYQIRYKLASDSSWILETQTRSISPTVLNKLTPNKYYEIQVAAVDDVTAVWSNSIFALTPGTIAIANPLLDLKFRGNYSDSSANNFTPTSQGQVSIIEDSVRGQVLLINPAGNSETSGLSYPCGCPASYTKSLWVNLNSTALINQNLFSSGEASGANFLWIPTNGEINFGQLTVFDAAKTPIGSFIYPNTWLHVACTHNNGVGQLFINGGMVSSVTGMAAFPGLAAPSPMGVGCMAGFQLAMTGKISNVKFYASALTATQIREIYYQEYLAPLPL